MMRGTSPIVVLLRGMFILVAACAFLLAGCDQFSSKKSTGSEEGKAVDKRSAPAPAEKSPRRLRSAAKEAPPAAAPAPAAPAAGKSAEEGRRAPAGKLPDGTVEPGDGPLTTPESTVAAKSPEGVAPTEGKVAPAAGITVAAIYDPRGKPDPFRPPFRSSVQGTAQDKKSKTPLQRFELDQLKLVAIIWGVGNSKALIQDPSGTEYIVHVGTPVGKNEGVITRIDDKRVWIKETYVDFQERVTRKDVYLEIESVDKRRGPRGG